MHTATRTSTRSTGRVPVSTRINVASVPAKSRKHITASINKIKTHAQSLQDECDKLLASLGLGAAGSEADATGDSSDSDAGDGDDSFESELGDELGEDSDEDGSDATGDDFNGVSVNDGQAVPAVA